MSNVLIGIIGVILFIGLAMAGALFLGPRFQQSSSQSKASSLGSSLAQIAHALSLREVDTGVTQPATATVLAETVSDGYLKAIPVSAVDPAKSFVIPTKPGA